MELNDNTTRQAYIKLLEETLSKKAEVLKKLVELTTQQEIIISSENMNEDEFLLIVDQKEEQIHTLSMLDDGFEKVFQRVRDELFNNKAMFSDAILTLKKLIAEITDLSVNLQAMEKRNKIKMEAYFTTKRKEIRNSRISSKTVTNYYKNMSKQQDNESYFYDRKK